MPNETVRLSDRELLVLASLRCAIQRTGRARIKKDGCRQSLGRFASEEDAARAYDLAARELFGEFCCLNFPERAAP